MDISTLNECMYSSAPSKNCSESGGRKSPHCQNNTLGHIQIQQQTKVAGGRGAHFLDPYLAPPSAAGLLDPSEIRVWARAPFINLGRVRICGGTILKILFCSDVLYFVRRGDPHCAKHNEADKTFDNDCMRVAVCIRTQ